MFSDLKEKNDKEEMSLKEMKKKLESINKQMNIDSLSSGFLGKINEMKSVVDSESTKDAQKNSNKTALATEES